MFGKRKLLSQGTQIRIFSEFSLIFLFSSGAMLLLISKDSLLQQSTIFAVQTALLYGVPLILVHDLVTCTFPAVWSLPSVYKVTKILRKFSYQNDKLVIRKNILEYSLL